FLGFCFHGDSSVKTGVDPELSYVGILRQKLAGKSGLSGAIRAGDPNAAGLLCSRFHELSLIFEGTLPAARLAVNDGLVGFLLLHSSRCTRINLPVVRLRAPFSRAWDRIDPGSSPGRFERPLPRGCFYRPSAPHPVRRK